jgi:uncharacterized protein with FMN-binding domain
MRERRLPYLRQEFLTAQSANVQLVSGATYTSQTLRTEHLRRADDRAGR